MRAVRLERAGRWRNASGTEACRRCGLAVAGLLLWAVTVDAGLLTSKPVNSGPPQVGPISDTDSLGTFSYQWVRVGSDAISGATGSTHARVDAMPLMASTNGIKRGSNPIGHAPDRGVAAGLRPAGYGASPPKPLVLALSRELNPSPFDKDQETDDPPDGVPGATEDRDDDGDQLLEPTDITDSNHGEDDEFIFHFPPDGRPPPEVRAVEAARLASIAARKARLYCVAVAAACDASDTAAGGARRANAAAEAVRAASTLPEAEFAAAEAEHAAEIAIAAARTAARIAAGDAGRTLSTYVMPLFSSADDERQGLLRIANLSDRAGTVQILGNDDSGRVFGPVEVSLPGHAARNLTSRDLEAGNGATGLITGLGDGQGSWRLTLQTHLDIELGAYIRNSDGFLTPVHEVVQTFSTAEGTLHRVPIFHPRDDRNRVSRLRLVNLSGNAVEVTVRGRDDEGRSAPGGEVGLSLPPGGSRTLTAEHLENGASGLAGRLGDGTGKWQLFVTSDGTIQVVSLAQTSTGRLANLSRSGLRRTETKDAGSSFRDCAECPAMIVVPAGSYSMGSPAGEEDRDEDEGPVHLAKIEQAFAVGRYETTFSQWDACYEAGGCAHRPADQGWGRGDRPVVDVNWYDAQEYVRWLSGKTGRQYRLLNESEWEYIARAETSTRYWWGDDIGHDRANCDGCGSRWDAQRTAPVGSFQANNFGAYDVHGNVWEWVEDCYTESYESSPDDEHAYPAGDCDRRIVRGGSWQSGTIPRYLRAANRGWNAPGSRLFIDNAAVGFRVARALDAANRHVLPLFLAAGRMQYGYARIVNHSERAGTVTIYGIDDSGQRRGPIVLALKARESRHFSSRDLETGNASAGLTGTLGDGTGDWRLELTSDLDIEPSAYAVTTDGLVAPMHGIVRTTRLEDDTVHHVPILDPGDGSQMNWLRLVNVGRETANVTILGYDDAGQPAPDGNVHLSLRAGAARTLFAWQVEEGDVDLLGRLGDGKGIWRLSVIADGAIEVLSLRRSAQGHLSNLSTASPAVNAKLVIATDAPATIRPLQTISMSVAGGLSDTDYAALVDLSGNGSFDDEHTIEVALVTTDRDRLLLAAPMTQTLSEENETHEFAVRVKRASDGAVSNTLNFSLQDMVVPSNLSGYPSTMLEVFHRAIYASSDDPLLQLDASAINPGALSRSARNLSLDTTIADVQAEAILRSVLGLSLVEWVEETASRSPIEVTDIHSSGLSDVQPLGLPTSNSQSSECPPGLFRPVCRAYEKTIDCVDGLLEIAINTGETPDDEPCFNRASEIPDAWQSSMEKVPTIGRLFHRIAPRLANKFASKKSIAQLSGRLAISKQVLNSIKTVREGYGTVSNLKERRRDFAYDKDEVPVPRKRELTNSFKAMKGIVDHVARDIPGLTRRVESEYGGKTLSSKERESVSTIVNEGDRLQNEAKRLEDLEGAYSGDDPPVDAIKANPRLAQRAADSCATGYQEFVIDDNISTCVFRTLVEANCYAGSRRVAEVDLGGSDACLYYSLDFFQPNDSCRENYSRVYFLGRWTCRWSGLGADKPAWYTLHKTLEEKPSPPDPSPPDPSPPDPSPPDPSPPDPSPPDPSPPDPSPPDPSPPGDGSGKLSFNASQDRITGPEGLSAIGYTFSNIPAPPSNIPPAPSVGGLDSGCHGDRDNQNRRIGRWVCVFSGSISFNTYRAGVLHGPTGDYGKDGQPDGFFGNYENGKREGVWVHAVPFVTSFNTYRAGVLHGPTGDYGKDGQRDGFFGSYSNGRRTGTWTYYVDGDARDTQEY